MGKLCKIGKAYSPNHEALKLSLHWCRLIIFTPKAGKKLFGKIMYAKLGRSLYVQKVLKS